MTRRKLGLNRGHFYTHIAFLNDRQEIYRSTQTPNIKSLCETYEALFLSSFFRPNTPEVIYRFTSRERKGLSTV